MAITKWSIYDLGAPSETFGAHDATPRTMASTTTTMIAAITSSATMMNGVW